MDDMNNNLVLGNSEHVERIDQIVNDYQNMTLSDHGPAMRSWIVGRAMVEINKCLTPEVMKPIMQLCGHPLGFRTDRDHTGSGYSEDIVKDCYLESLLMGLWPVMNHWNIIASRTYITKEGFTFKLNNIDGLTYEIIPGIPEVKKSPDWGGYYSLISVIVSGNYGDNAIKKNLTFQVRGSQDRSGKHITMAEAYQGKAERKAKKWLYNYITGNDLSDGDVSDAIDTTAREIISDELIDEPSPYVATNKTDIDAKKRLWWREFCGDIGLRKVKAFLADNYHGTKIQDYEQDLGALERLVNNDPSALKNEIEKHWIKVTDTSGT